MNNSCTLECSLCEMVRNSLSIRSELQNTILSQTKNFIITPSIGPLTVGHILVTSKAHYPSLASMEASEISEFIDLFKSISKKNTRLLFSEHGTFNFDKGGGCIDHTHIHILPNMDIYINILDGILIKNHLINHIDNLHKLKEIQHPYILIIDSYGNVNLYEAYNTHSQILRKAICNIENRLDWNWRNYEITHALKESISYWKNKI